MFFIFGGGIGMDAYLYLGLRYCENCHRVEHYHVYMQYHHISFFFLPLFKWSKEYVIACDHCRSGRRIDKETLEKCKQLNARLLPERTAKKIIKEMKKDIGYISDDEILSKYNQQYPHHHKEIIHMLEKAKQYD